MTWGHVSGANRAQPGGAAQQLQLGRARDVRRRVLLLAHWFAGDTLFKMLLRLLQGQFPSGKRSDATPHNGVAAGKKVVHTCNACASTGALCCSSGHMPVL